MTSLHSQAVAASFQANASVIAISDATQRVKDQGRAAIRVPEMMSQRGVTFLSSRSQYSLDFLQTKKVTGSHPVMSAMRNVVFDRWLHKFFEMSNEKGHWVPKPAYSTTVFLFLGCADREITLFGRNLNCYFHIANFEAKDFGRTEKLQIAGSTVGDDEVSRIIAGAAHYGVLSHRLFIGEFPTTLRAQYLVGFDMAYNMSGAVWADLFHHTGAIKAYITLLCPFELIAPELPANDVYECGSVRTFRSIKGSQSTQRVWKRGTETYKIALDSLRRDVRQHGYDIILRPMRGFFGKKHFGSVGVSYTHHVFMPSKGEVVSPAEYQRMHAQDVALALSVVDDLYETLCEVYRKSKRPSIGERIVAKFEEMEHDLRGFTNEVFGLDPSAQFEDFQIRFKSDTGTYDHAYTHNRATWREYFSPGWMIPPDVALRVDEEGEVDSDVRGTTQLVVQHVFQLGIMHLIEIFPTTKSGALTARFSLPRVDQYAKILNVEGSLKSWRAGVARKFKFCVYPLSVLDPVRSYLKSLSPEQIFQKTTFSTACQFLRRQFSAADIMPGQVTQSVATMTDSDMTRIFLACVLEAREFFNTIDNVITAYTKTGLSERFAARIWGMFDDTCIESFFKAYSESRWKGQFVTPVVNSYMFTTHFEEIADLPPVEHLPVSAEEDEGAEDAPEVPDVVVSDDGVVDFAPAMVAEPAEPADPDPKPLLRKGKNREKVDNSCNVCRYAKLAYGETHFRRCEHHDPFVWIQIKRKELEEYVTQLASNDADPVGIVKVKEIAKKAINDRLYDHHARVEVRLIVGPPGTGKSFLARDIMEQMYLEKVHQKGAGFSALVVAPFNALQSDYTGSGVRASKGKLRFTTEHVTFKTLHRAYAEIGKAWDVLIVDELGGFDMRFIQLFACCHPEVPIYMFGDPNQTTLRKSEGVAPFYWLEDNIKGGLKAINTHSLYRNYRNPDQCVLMANGFTQDVMEPCTGRKGGITAVWADHRPNWWKKGDPDSVLDALGVKYAACDHFAFTKKTYALAFPDCKEGDEQTVRADQGKTHDFVVLYVSNADASLLHGESGDAQTLVALTRHRYQLIIVFLDSGSRLVNWAQRVGFRHWSEYANTRMPARFAHAAFDVKEQESVKEAMELPGANAAQVHQLGRAEALAVDNTLDHYKTIAAATPVAVPTRAYKLGVDWRHDLTAANLPKVAVKVVERLVSDPDVLQQRVSGHTVRAALAGRQNRQLADKVIPENARQPLYEAVVHLDNLLKDYAVPNLYDELTDDLVNWLEAAQQRNYIARAEAQGDDLVGADMKAWHGTASLLRGSMKAQAKITNLQKGAPDLHKIGQALTATTANQCVRNAVFFRLLQTIDTLTDKRTGPHVLLSKQKKPEAQFNAEWRSAMKQFDRTPCKARYHDGSQTDSGSTRGTTDLVALRLAIMCAKVNLFGAKDEEDETHRFLRYYDLLYELMNCAGLVVRGHNITFSVRCITPSGELYTLLKTEMSVSTLGLLSSIPRDSYAPFVAVKTGDDFIIWAPKLFDQPAMDALISSFTNIKLTRYDCDPGWALEFGGSLMTQYQMSDGSYMPCVAPYLARRVKKAFNTEYRDEKHFNESQKAFRHMANEMRNDEVLRNTMLTLGAKVLVQESPYDEPMSWAVAMATITHLWSSYLSLGRCTWSQVIESGSKVTLGVGPLGGAGILL